jgi:ABC-type transport system substrate-binding protein
MERRSIGLLVLLLVSLTVFLTPAGAAAAEGQMTWGVYTTLVPTWFDPAETLGIVTPFMFMYALHDAVVKPMPGNAMTPSLAESWTMSKDGLVYEFVLRKGVRFHNGEPVTAEDVKFSFERYRGASAKALSADRRLLWEVPEEAWDLVLNVNLKGAYPGRAPPKPPNVLSAPAEPWRSSNSLTDRATPAPSSPR